MASFVRNSWRGHFYISLSELCFENALGLLINNRSNFREEWIIVRIIATTFREERIIARKFTVNYRAKRIIVRKITRIKTIGVTKMRGNFIEISFRAKLLRKAPKSQEFRRNSFALLLHNTVYKSCLISTLFVLGKRASVNIVTSTDLTYLWNNLAPSLVKFHRSRSFSV